jgi:hypothetical protein
MERSEGPAHTHDQSSASVVNIAPTVRSCSAARTRKIVATVAAANEPAGVSWVAPANVKLCSCLLHSFPLFSIDVCVFFRVLSATASACDHVAVGAESPGSD